MRSLSRLTIISLATLLHEAVDAQSLKNPRDWVSHSPGTLPIIVTAPHGGREAIPGLSPRRGLGVPQFTVERDSNTAELAQALADKLATRLGGKPFLVTARFERKFVDANRLETAAFESPEAKPYYDAYHAAIVAALEEVHLRWGSGVLLDLHGQGADRETIFRGTDNGKSVTALERRFGRGALTGSLSILGHMAWRGYRIEPRGDDRERRYTGGFTTRTYGSHRAGGIDAIQLEFGTNLRNKAQLERTAEDLAAAVEIFARAYLPLASAVAREQQARQP